MVEVVPAVTLEAIASARRLFEEYFQSRPNDPALLGLAEETAELPGEYVPPGGCLLLAYHETHAAGCVALRDLGGGIAEMKRLYVRPAMRGLGIGKALVEAVIVEARRIGYERVRLDTLPSMEKAQALYRALGFVEIAPYRYNPNEGTRFFELELRG
jgi:putative acetyltransferase